MAEWGHKERSWREAYIYDNSSGRKISGTHMTFAHWLDMQCEDGWELFKIFRDHHTGRNDCIFRRG